MTKYYAWHVVYDGDTPVYQGTTQMIAEARGVSNQVCRTWLARIRHRKIKKYSVVSFEENDEERAEHKRRNVNQRFKNNHMKKNVIEWVTGEDVMTVSFTQQKYINKIKKLAEEWPYLVSILDETDDGGINARLTLKALKLFILSPSRGRFRKKEESEE